MQCAVAFKYGWLCLKLVFRSITVLAIWKNKLIFKDLVTAFHLSHPRRAQITGFHHTNIISNAELNQYNENKDEKNVKLLSFPSLHFFRFKPTFSLSEITFPSLSLMKHLMGTRFLTSPWINIFSFWKFFDNCPNYLVKIIMIAHIISSINSK